MSLDARLPCYVEDCWNSSYGVERLVDGQYLPVCASHIQTAYKEFARLKFFGKNLPYCDACDEDEVEHVVNGGALCNVCYKERSAYAVQAKSMPGFRVPDQTFARFNY